jgi:hypothetical protein
MVKRFFLFALAAVLAWTSAGAEIAWPENTGGQRMLKAYAETANRFLIEQGEAGINSLFEAYPGLEVFGITDLPGAEVPEQVEITANLFPESINSLQVRVSEPARFPRICAAFLQALSPETTREDALTVPTQRMQRAAKAPENSFEDEVETLNGTEPYVYYAYYPNQYHDGVNWLQMTIVFPLEGSWDGGGFLTGAQTTPRAENHIDYEPDYEGSNLPPDDYVHYEIFVTATPEPDSAAAEEDYP